MESNHIVIQSRPQKPSVYTACDQKYFKEFGAAFANSVLVNSDFDVHFHIFNPDQQDIEFCASNARITVSHEQIPVEKFAAAAELWKTAKLDEIKQQHLNRTLNAMSKGGDRDLQERMQKTYYACARFVRLAEIFDPRWQMFAMDVDAVLRKTLLDPGPASDFYIHRIHGKKARFLAGGIWLHARSINQRFLKDYANSILAYFQRDYVYWGIDQDVLEGLVPKYSYGHLPQTYIDWNMAQDSMVWTAKGTRKSDSKFLAAKSQFACRICDPADTV